MNKVQFKSKSSVQAHVGQLGSTPRSNTKKSPQCVVRIRIDIRQGCSISST
jgi:hypothetical protein